MMETTDKQRMCFNCHGRIPASADACLYCGQEQTEQAAEAASQTTLFEHQSLQESLTSLYSPPYGAKRPSSPREEPPPAKIRSSIREIPELKRTFAPKENELSPSQEETAEPSTSFSIFALLLMIIGGALFSLGLIQLVFSDNGLLTLQWRTDSWYFYCLAATPLLFVGYRLASKLLPR